MPLFKPNLATMKQKRDVQALVETMQTRDAAVRQEARQAIIDLGKPVLGSLTAILANERINSAIQTDVAEILGAIPDESSIEVLLRAVEMSRQREVALIEQSTNATDRTYRAGFYVNQIATAEGLYRNAIATALGKIGGMRAVKALFKMMTEEQGAMASNIQLVVKTAMSDALRHADGTVIRHLSEMMPSGSVPARVMVTECLAQVGGDQAIAELLEIAADEHEEFPVRASAVAGIGKIADRRIIPDLEQLQYSGNRTFVREVQGALEAIRMHFPPPPIE